jgi:hypothetical protein
MLPVPTCSSSIDTIAIVVGCVEAVSYHFVAAVTLDYLNDSSPLESVWIRVHMAELSHGTGRTIVTSTV